MFGERKKTAFQHAHLIPFVKYGGGNIAVQVCSTVGRLERTKTWDDDEVNEAVQSWLIIFFFFF